MVESRNQNYKLPDNFQWIHKNVIYRICEHIIYLIAYIFGCVYTKFFLHVKYVNKHIVDDYKDAGYFIFGNHTQLIGDVFIPTRITRGKRIYVVISPANIGIPVIGPLLPIMGGLPISDNIRKLKDLWNAINVRVKQRKCVVIYPEAHVWPYYTGIRPFTLTSFRFPVDLNVPVFAMTTTYQKRKRGSKPGITVYVDGPFIPDEGLSRKERQQKLHDEIYDCMLDRSKNSNYEFIQYEEAN